MADENLLTPGTPVMIASGMYAGHPGVVVSAPQPVWPDETEPRVCVRFEYRQTDYTYPLISDVKIGPDTSRRDALTRALIAAVHRRVLAEVREQAGDPDTDDCGGYHAERCGGCAECVWMQATYRDYGEDHAKWQALAQDLLDHMDNESGKDTA